MSYAAAAKPAVVDPFLPKKAIIRKAATCGLKVSHQDVTEAAAGLTVDYMHHIWEFCAKYEEIGRAHV